MAALPCALVTGAAVLVLGPIVGHLLSGPGAEGLWPRGAIFIYGQPEPVKHGRYLVALLGPVLLAGAVLASHDRRLRLRDGVLRGWLVSSQALLAAGVLAVTLAQHDVVYASLPPAWRIFTLRTLVVALAIALALAVAPRVPVAARWRSLLAADGRRTRIACSVVAILATALWLLPAITTESSIARSAFPDLPPWAMGDASAIVDGRTPLVDFHPLYGYLWAYLAALPMRVIGPKIGVFSVVMVSGSALALLAVYSLLRRVASPPRTLALYLPFLATSLFIVATPGPLIVSNSEIYSVWPMRYGGPLLLAWLTGRHLDGAAPRRPWVVLLVAGLVALNNLEFGLGALLGTLTAIACTPAAWSRGALRRLAGSLAGGVLMAALLVALLTLGRSGELPRFGMLLEFPRLFGVLGLAELPVRLVGFQLAIYATFAAALATAAVRVARREPDVVLTGMLAWSAVFGLVAGSYFMGRSDPLKLAALFPAWALALTLLLVVAIRSLAARAWRRPSLAELIVLFGFGLAVCSLAQLPSPWRQLRRLEPGHAQTLWAQPKAHGIVERNTAPGQRVAILIPMGHRIAYDLHLVNVSPYGFMEEIATRKQMRTLLGALREKHAHKLFVRTQDLVAEHRGMLAQAGFSEREVQSIYSYWADTTVPRR